MSALTPWDPFRELDELQNRLATMFGRIPQRQGARTGNEAMTTADWAPMVDISEDENAFILKLDLPEVPKDAVRVSAENGVLTISGERKLEKEEQGKKFHRIERAYGRFVRSFVLPDNVDPTKVTASMKDGVLEVRLVKAEQAKPKQIEISVKPVSRTENSSLTCDSIFSSSATLTSISPRSVNLNAFETRLVRIWPSRCGSPTRFSGISGGIMKKK